MDTKSEGFRNFLLAAGNLSKLFTEALAARESNIQSLVQVKGLKSPQRLYHYTSLQATRGIVRSANLWATEARFLNDSTELSYGTALIADELTQSAQEFSENEGKLIMELANLMREHGQHFRDFFETYIISLSEQPDMLGQWRAYADQAKGHCLEFDFSDSRLFATGGTAPVGLDILSVMYEERLQRSLVRSGISRVVARLRNVGYGDEALRSLSSTERGVTMGLLYSALSPFVIGFKHPGFAEEKEWRAIATCPGTTIAEARKERQVDGKGVNYLECIFLQGDEQKLWQRKLLPLTGIMNGPRCPETSRQELLTLLDSEGYKGKTAVSSSRIPLR